jgi:hypothetical protein
MLSSYNYYYCNKYSDKGDNVMKDIAQEFTSAGRIPLKEEEHSITTDEQNADKLNSDYVPHSKLRPELREAARASWKANKRVYMALKGR